MSDVECPTWQKLVDESYDRWQDGGDLHKKSYEQFLFELSPVHRKAVLLANFNGQTLNGGIHQWCSNGYCTQIDNLAIVVEQIDTESSAKVMEILKKLEPKIRKDIKNRGCMGDYWKKPANSRRYYDDEDDESEENEMMDFCSELDDIYYEISDQFEADVEAFLLKESAK